MGQGCVPMSAGAQRGRGVRSPGSRDYRQRELRTGIGCRSFAEALFVFITEPSLQSHPFPVSTPSPTRHSGPLLTSADSTRRCFLERCPGRRNLAVQMWLGMTMDARPKLLHTLPHKIWSFSVRLFLGRTTSNFISNILGEIK